MSRCRPSLLVLCLLAQALSAQQPRRARFDPVVVPYGEDDAVPLARIAAGLLVGDTVVIADGGTLTLRFYGAGGKLLKSVGGKGEGPGEFGTIDWLQLRGDRIYAMDSENQRLEVFSRSGVLRQELSLRNSNPNLRTYVVGVLADATLLATRSLVAFQQPPKGPTVSRDTIVVYHLNATGQRADSVAWLLSFDHYSEPVNGGAAYSAAILGRPGFVAAGTDRFYTMENLTPTVRVFGPTGRPMPPITVTYGNDLVKVLPADIATLRNALQKSARDPATAVALFDRKPRPVAFPYFGWSGRRLPAMHVGSGGDVWLLHFGGLRDTLPTWSVIGATGKTRGLVTGTLPLRLLDASGDRVLAIRWDEDDVEHVELRRVRW